MDDLQLALIQTNVEMPKLKALSIDFLPATEDLDLEKGDPQPGFVQDIYNRGQLEEVRVLKVGLNKYSVIAGNKRVAAIRQLHERLPEDTRWNTVRAIVINDNSEAIMTSAVASNHQRKLNVVTDIKGIRFLKSKYPLMGEKAMALSLGMPLQTLKKRLKLFQLNDTLLDALLARKFTVKAAEYLATRPGLWAGAIAAIAENKTVSMDSLTDLERVRHQENINSVSDQLFPILPDIDTEQISNEMVLLGVALTDGNNFITNLLSIEEMENYLSANPVMTGWQKVYIYNK